MAATGVDRLVERVGRRGDRGAVADPDVVPSRTAVRSTCAPSRPTIRRVRSSGPGDRRREVRRHRARSCCRRASAAGTLGGRRVDDPDLDDALGPGPLEQPRDLRSRDAELLGDRALGLTQLVVEPARADELLEVAHRATAARGTDVLNRCACIVRGMHSRPRDRRQRVSERVYAGREGLLRALPPGAGRSSGRASRARLEHALGVGGATEGGVDHARRDTGAWRRWSRTRSACCIAASASVGRPAASSVQA